MRRRDFLKHGVILPAACASVDAGNAAAPRKSRFIDAHVHIWTDDTKNYPMAPGINPAGMSPPAFLPEDILRHARPSGVDRVVLIQMSCYEFDNSYMIDTIRRQPKVFGGIAIVNPRSQDPDVKMRELARRGVRGFRISAGGAPESWLDGEGFEKMFRCGAEKQLALCPIIGPKGLGALGRQCEKFPEAPVIIDHLALIGTDGAPITDSNISALCALSRHRQVKVKVSAFYALGARKPPHHDLIPLIRRVYEAFGPQRLMWASDCPFQVRNETYEDSISLVRDRLDFLSPADKEWILRRTAEEFFFP